MNELKKVRFSERLDEDVSYKAYIPLDIYNMHISMRIPEGAKTISLSDGGWVEAYFDVYDVNKDFTLNIAPKDYYEKVYCGAVYDYWHTTTLWYKVIDGKLVPYEML